LSARCARPRVQPLLNAFDLVGNSAFAFIGNYVDRDDGIQVKVSTQRHNPDPAFRPLFGNDNITLTLRGAENGDMVDFEGTALQLPGVAFRAVLTRISD
jgi:hypothetical protein